MATPLGDIVARVSMDVTGLKRGVDQATSQMTKLRSSMNTGIGIAAKYSAAMAAAGAAIVGTLVKKSFDAIDAQAKLARQLRATNVGLETLTRAADLAGVEQQKMTMAVRRLDVAVGESIRGTATYKDAFDALGLSAQKVSEMDADQRINAINQALRENVPAAQQAQVAGVLFGNRVGVAVASISADELVRAREEVEALGLAVSEVDSQTIERLNDDISTLREVFRGLVNRIAVKLAPLVEVIAKRMKEAAIESRGFESSVDSAFTTAIRFAGMLGDGVQGLKVALAGLNTVFAGIAAAWWNLQGAIITGLAELVDGITSSINYLHQQANKLLPDSLQIPMISPASESAFVKKIDGITASAVARFDELKEGLHDLAMQEMPSDRIEGFIEEVRAMSAEASKAAEEARAALAGEVSEDGGGDDGKNEKLQARLDSIRESLMSQAELERKHHAERLKDLNAWHEAGLDADGEYNTLREKMMAEHQARMHEIENGENEARLEGLSQKLEGFKQSLMTEAEIETAHHQARFEALTEFRENELISEGEYQKLKEEMLLQHQDRMSAIEQAGLTERQRFEQASMRQKAKTISSELANITAGVSQHNRKLFELNKVAGIANAIVNAYEGISKTMSAYPYPINVGMAAAHAAAAFAQVSAIKSASFGGGSAPSIAGSTPATPVTPVTSGAPSAIGGRLAVEGIDPSAMFSGAQMRELAERLQEHIKDGGTLVFV